MISPSVVRWRASRPIVRRWLTRTVGAAAALLFAAAVGSAQPAPPPSGTAAPQEVMGAGEAAGILGRPVVDPGGRPLGRIVDVLVDETGQPRAAVVDFGGFMGLGQRRVAVAWRALRFGATGSAVTVALEAERIASTPEYRPGGPVAVAAPP